MVATALVFAKAGPGDIIALGASVVLLGLLVMALRAHPLAPVLGLLTAQNGLVLVVSASPNIQFVTAFVVAVPLTPAIVLANSWSRR